MPKRNASLARTKEFKVFGRFELKRFKGSAPLDPAESEKAVTDHIELHYPRDNLDTKRGCYIIGIRKSSRTPGGSLTPWYVGKAVRQSLLKESLNCEKWKKVFPQLGAEKGTVVMYWIAKAAPGHKEKRNADAIGKMERELIAHAARCNPSLINTHHNTELPFVIRGLPLGKQRHRRAKIGAAKALRTMLLGPTSGNYGQTRDNSPRGTDFKAFGPFKLKRIKGSGQLDRDESEKAVKAHIKKRYGRDNVLEKGGCYIIGICKSSRTRGGSCTTRYVGKAVSQKLLGKSLNDKRLKEVCVELGATKGTVVMFWIAKAARGHKEKLNATHIDRMARELITAAACSNPDLINSHHNTDLPFVIRGLPLGKQQHPREKEGAAKELGTMLQN